MIKNWDNWSALVHHAFYNEARIAPEEAIAVYAVPPLCPKADLEKILQEFMEIFSCRAVSLVSSSYLSLKQHGLKTGLSIICGHSRTYAAPVYEGYQLSHTCVSNQLAGDAVSKFLGSETSDRHTWNDSNRSVLNKMKEELCFISRHFEQDNAKHSSEFERIFKVNDEVEISLQRERFCCPEIIFNPNFIGNSEPGIAQLAYSAILNCDSDLREMISKNIVLTGGSTLFPNFSDRFTSELREKTNLPFKVIDGGKGNDRNFTIVNGGISLSNDCDEIMNRAVFYEDYQEYGPTLIHRLIF